MSEKQKKVLIAASGSGGHLMPARLIAEALIAQGVTVEFVGSGRPLENEIFGSLDISMHTIPITGINNLGIAGAIKFLIKLPSALLKTRKLLKEAHVDAVVGVGGYASVLPVMLASWMKLPTWIHEAELAPGKANRFLSRFAKVISVAFKETKGFSPEKIRFTGHPVRSDVAAIAGKKPAVDRPTNVLVLGGSQGARALDLGLTEYADWFAENGISLWHQCRPENKDEVVEKYNSAGVDAKVMPFIQNLGEAYDWSHMIVCRAGAGTIMELGIVNRPAIIVPFPHAQGKHQHKNAATIVDIGKAVLIDEQEEDFVGRLGEAIKELADSETYAKFLNAPSPDRPVDAAERIALGVIELVQSSVIARKSLERTA